MKSTRLRVRPLVAALTSLLALPTAAYADTIANPLCPDNTALFNPGTGQDIIVPAGFKVSVFAKGLNFPTGIAFRGTVRWAVTLKAATYTLRSDRHKALRRTFRVTA